MIVNIYECKQFRMTAIIGKLSCAGGYAARFFRISLEFLKDAIWERSKNFDLTWVPYFRKGPAHSSWLWGYKKSYNVHCRQGTMVDIPVFNRAQFSSE